MTEPRSAPFAAAESVLLRAEGAIRLLDRVSPVNGAAERERLSAAFARGESPEPRLRYAPSADLSATRRALERVGSELASGDALAREYAERARELELEAGLVAALGSPRFPALAAERFAPERLFPGGDVAALVEDWLAAPPAEAAERVASDDARHPESLLSVLRREIGARALPIRVELSPALSAVAAAGENTVLVRPSVLLAPDQARRIAAHELEAHVLPRLAARSEPVGLFRTGFRGSGDEEEGRALLIEERGSFLDGARRRELALRHRAADAVRSGASFVEAVRALSAAGAPLEQAVELALRAARGGGLAREIVYVPAYLALRVAFERDPELESYFRRGRASIAGARLLARLRGGPGREKVL